MGALSFDVGIIAAFGGCILFGVLAVYEAGGQRRRIAARIGGIVQAAGGKQRQASRVNGRPWQAAIAPTGLMERVVGRLKLLSSKEAVAGRLLLSRAGLLSDRALITYMFMRVSMPTMFGLVTLLDAHFLHILPVVSRAPALAACLATVIGFYGPTLMLKNTIARRQADLRKSLPDGIDLLVICVESGASINEAFARVGRELSRGHAALADEFAITAAELSFLPVRRVALDNLLERTGLPAIRGLVATMLQSERFGTPIAQALRALSAEFRHARMMAAENRAAKLPVLLTVPMIVFILPVLFIVLLGPAVLTILDSMAK